MTAHPSRFRPRLLWVLALSAALTGCATMQSHDKLATDMQTAGRSGGIPAALASLDLLQANPERFQQFEVDGDGGDAPQWPASSGAASAT